MKKKKEHQKPPVGCLRTNQPNLSVSVVFRWQNPSDGGDQGCSQEGGEDRRRPTGLGDPSMQKHHLQIQEPRPPTRSGVLVHA